MPARVTNKEYVSNKEIADILYNVSELLEIEEANRFRVNAYRNAALTVMNSREPLAKKVERGDDLVALPTIGDEIARHIEEISRTGELTLLEELEHSMSPVLVELSRVPGIGPKRVKTIIDHLGVLSFSGIKSAAESDELARLPGIGTKTAKAIKAHFLENQIEPQSFPNSKFDYHQFFSTSQN